MEYNIQIGSCPKWLKCALFGREKVIKKEDSTLQVLLKGLGIVSSTSEAFRNGWKGEIPNGFSDFSYGKKKNIVNIIKYTKFPEPSKKDLEKMKQNA